MCELKCFALDVDIEKTWDDAFLDKLKACEGLVGVSPDADNDVVHILFHTVNARNEAYKKLKKYGVVVVASTAYVSV